MSESLDHIAQRLAHAEVLIEQLELDQALHVAASAWRLADALGEHDAAPLAVRGRLIGSSVLMHQLRLAEAESLVRKASALHDHATGHDSEAVLYALRLLRCFRGNAAGVRQAHSRDFSRDVLALFAHGGASLDPRTHPLTTLRHHEAVLVSATTRDALQRDAFRALLAARAIVERLDDAEGREDMLLELVAAIYWLRYGEREKGLDSVERVYDDDRPTPLQELRRGLLAVTELSANGDFKDADYFASQFVERCLEYQMLALGSRALTLTRVFGSDAWRTTPLLELII